MTAEVKKKHQTQQIYLKYSHTNAEAAKVWQSEFYPDRNFEAD